MKLITWNIQWGLGVDGRVDLARIVHIAREMADFDVLCLQEISDGYGALQGNDGSDQFADLRALLPQWRGLAGIAVERPLAGGGSQRFGNMIFTRLPVSQVLHHQLPWPAEAANVPTMPRMALEAVLEARSGPLRVTTTHLEFYSDRQRRAQAAALRQVQEEACGHGGLPVQAHKRGSPFETRPRGASGILCGDFNCLPGDAALALLQQPAAHGTPGYVDGWTIAHPGRPHAPTAGVHDAGPPRCLDYVFVSADIAARVRRLDVFGDTDASDHQPLLLEIDS